MGKTPGRRCWRWRERGCTGARRWREDLNAIDGGDGGRAASLEYESTEGSTKHRTEISNDYRPEETMGSSPEREPRRNKERPSQAERQKNLKSNKEGRDYEVRISERREIWDIEDHGELTILNPRKKGESNQLGQVSDLDERKVIEQKKKGEMSLGPKLKKSPIKILLSNDLGLESRINGSPIKVYHCLDPDEVALPSHLENACGSEGDSRIPRARKWKRQAREKAEQPSAEGQSDTIEEENVEKKRKACINGCESEVEEKK
ncbi:hypothetical protein U1Q18_000191 [Sarracenia purpurea var. burkii]